MAQAIKRQTAVKIWISNLVNGNYVKQDGDFESNYVEVNGKQIGRVNIIATVVFKFQSEDNNYLSITLDDGSCQIRVKAWNEATDFLKNINVGDTINLIGRPREFNEEIYIVPEIVKKIVDLHWELARKAELLKEYGKPMKVDSTKQSMPRENTRTTKESEVVEEKVEESENRQKILELIEKLGAEGGVETEEITKQSGMDKDTVEEVVLELLKNGEIYEPRPNVLRVL